MLMVLLLLLGKVCDQAQYQCSNGDCINISRKCDKVKDCLDGSDEMDCPSGQFTIIICHVQLNLAYKASGLI